MNHASAGSCTKGTGGSDEGGAAAVRRQRRDDGKCLRQCAVHAGRVAGQPLALLQPLGWFSPLQQTQPPVD